MAEEEGLVKNKLSIPLRIRKWFFLQRLTKYTVYEYADLPEALKLDPEIVESVFFTNEALITNFPVSMATQYGLKYPNALKFVEDDKVLNKVLESKPEYLRAMSLQKIAAYINKNPMDVNRLTEEQITKLITSSLNYEPNFKFLQYLPLKKQEEYITLRGTVTYLRNNLDKFAEEAVVNVAEKDEERFKSGAPRIYNFRILEQYDLKKLPNETQQKLLTISDIYYPLVSEDAVSDYISKNPFMFEKLSDEMKRKLVLRSDFLAKKEHNDFGENRAPLNSNDEEIRE